MTTASVGITEREAAISLGVPALLEALAQFCDLNSDHINPTDAVSVGLESGWYPKVHMKANGNAARAVVFALDTVEDPQVLVCHYGDSRQVYVRGRFEGVPIELVSCSDEYDGSFIDTFVDWTAKDWLGFVAVSIEVLRAMAEHTS